MQVGAGCVPVADYLNLSTKPLPRLLTKNQQVDTTVLGLTAEEAKAKPYIASMGIYVFKKEVLLKLLRHICSTTTGKTLEVGTIKSFFDANLALIAQLCHFFTLVYVHFRVRVFDMTLSQAACDNLNIWSIENLN